VYLPMSTRLDQESVRTESFSLQNSHETLSGTVYLQNLSKCKYN